MQTHRYIEIIMFYWSGLQWLDNILAIYSPTISRYKYFVLAICLNGTDINE